MPGLNLPAVETIVREHPGGAGRREIFDPLRGRFVALTPEEWVRRHFTAYLIDSLGYPAGLMANEVSLRLNNMSRRCDTVVYSRCGLRPLMIVEYKAPAVDITQRTFDQIARYNMVLGARWLVVSNGLRHYCCRMDGEGSYTFVEQIPAYGAL